MKYYRRKSRCFLTWNGIYVPALDTPPDLNKDGIPDVVLYKTLPANRPAGDTYNNVSPTIHNVPNSPRLAKDTHGEVTWLSNIPGKWEEKNYNYPVPEDRTANPKVVQNPGW